MAMHHARSGELIDLRPLGESLRETVSQALVRADHLEVMRLVLPRDHQLPSHAIDASAITIQCLEGAVMLTAQDTTQRMPAGTLVYLAPGVAHAVKALEDSTLLVTLMLARP
ncbi:cupin domain-containing protein [Bordetella genomosp. 6]|uniref:cupin domain-containing protein n=1 Tax=Bordetella genomosp. 6 TaxID=463024 RepID=UPI000A296790|nr:cupin domain-containing protein [Bordetella genomosp. 6]ARP76117.1 cupin [Bordetella genomosp. 6]